MSGLGRAVKSASGSAIVAGAVMGTMGGLLAYLGNPANTGICVSCFLENAAGAVGMHSNPRMQYMRPELLGFFLGSFVAAAAFREFKPRWRGAGLSLLGLGFLMAVGCAVFIGCPIKAALRLAAGDLTAAPGMAGLVVGVWAGIQLLRTGEIGDTGSAQTAQSIVPLGLVLAAATLSGLVFFVPGFLQTSRAGGGALHAPAAVSLGAGAAIGFLCQRSRFCVTGAVRDALLTKKFSPAYGLGATLAGAMAVDAFTGQFRVGYYDQPGSHLAWVWSFVGMTLVGLVAVVARGCPFRQVVKAGEGDLDAAVVAVGMAVGAAAVQMWGLGGTAAGVPQSGKVAVLLGLAAVLSLTFRRQEENP